MWTEERDTRFSACKESSILLSHKYMTGALTAELMETAEVWANLREVILSLIQSGTTAGSAVCSYRFQCGPGTLLLNPAADRCVTCSLIGSSLNPVHIPERNGENNQQYKNKHYTKYYAKLCKYYDFLMTKPVKTSESCVHQMWERNVRLTCLHRRAVIGWLSCQYD